MGYFIVPKKMVENVLIDVQGIGVLDLVAYPKIKIPFFLEEPQYF